MAASAHDAAAKYHEKVDYDPATNATVAAHFRDSATAKIKAGATGSKASALEASRAAWDKTVTAHRERPSSALNAPKPPRRRRPPRGGGGSWAGPEDGRAPQGVCG